MALTHTEPAAVSTSQVAPGRLLIALSDTSADTFQATRNTIAQALPDHILLLATPDGSAAPAASEQLEILPYTPTIISSTTWVPTAAAFVNLFPLAEQHNAAGCLLLGVEAHTLSTEAVRALGEAVLVQRTDLVTPCYHLGPHDGLVNSAILYPVSRGLYGTRPRFPLAIDLGLSLRMVHRLAAVAQKFTATNQNEAILWPVAEAASASFTIAEIDAPRRTLPSPVAPDLNALLAIIAGSLFSDVEAKATFWQRSRTTQPPRNLPPAAESAPIPDIAPMIESFRLAYSNLHEIWSLVLPPNSLLGLKRLSQQPSDSFRMNDSLWARIIYDFILAFRLRTLNRGHLLGALTPLYLAWVASHLLLTSNGLSPEQHIEQQAAAFENDKPYLVSRWRWPDRFNP